MDGLGAGTANGAQNETDRQEEAATMRAWIRFGQLIFHSEHLCPRVIRPQLDLCDWHIF